MLVRRIATVTISAPLASTAARVCWKSRYLPVPISSLDPNSREAVRVRLGVQFPRLIDPGRIGDAHLWPQNDFDHAHPAVLDRQRAGGVVAVFQHPDAGAFAHGQVGQVMARHQRRHHQGLRVVARIVAVEYRRRRAFDRWLVPEPDHERARQLQLAVLVLAAAPVPVQ
jgi:hypothetical protein